MQELLKTLDTPVRLSEWFSYYLGNRIKKTSTNSTTNGSTSLTTRYILDPNRALASVLAETDASGDIQAYYVYGLGLISKIEGSNAYFYQYDGLGSTVAITDSSSNLKNQYAYDDFGNLATNSTESVANPFKYVGRFGVMTDVPDLLYMRARYYSPSLGRFINKDPIDLAGGMNLYGYVGNNPIRLIDPSGLGGAGGGWCSVSLWGQVKNVWRLHVQWHENLRKSFTEGGPYGQGGPYVALAGAEIIGLGTTLSGAGLTAIAGGGVAGVIAGGGWVIIGLEVVWIGIDVIGGFNDSLKQR